MGKDRCRDTARAGPETSANCISGCPEAILWPQQAVPEGCKAMFCIWLRRPANPRESLVRFPESIETADRVGKQGLKRTCLKPWRRFPEVGIDLSCFGKWEPAIRRQPRPARRPTLRASAWHQGQRRLHFANADSSKARERTDSAGRAAGRRCRRPGRRRPVRT